MTGNDSTSSATVVLIGGRAKREFDILHELGYRILYLDRHVPLQCMLWAEVSVEVDVDDWDLVAKTVRDQLDGSAPAAVLTHVEPRVLLMTHLASQLLSRPRGLTAEAALNCRDKWRTRNCLQEAGLPTPRFGLADDAGHAVRIAADIGFPVIVKPRDGAGSFGVRRCLTPNEVRHAVDDVLADPEATTQQGVLVEEYVDGPEYAVQALTRGGRTDVVSVIREYLTEPPVFVEIGYEYPSDLSDSDEAVLAQLVTSALDVLGIDDWVSHTQVRRGLDGFRIIEVNARRPGGRLVEMNTGVTGVDMTKAVTRLALGLPVTIEEAGATHALYTSIVFDGAGSLLYRPYIDASDPGDELPPLVEMDVSPGEPVLPAVHPEGGVYGRIIAFGHSAEEVRDVARRIHEALELQVVPLDDLEWEGSDSREFKPCC